MLDRLTLGSMVKSGAHSTFLLPPEGRISLHWATWAWERGDWTSENPSFIPSPIGLFLTSVLHSGAIISYLGSLALLKVFHMQIVV